LERARLFSIFFVSAGALAFQVALTRVFALTYWHHFAALLISLAMVGFGSAGSLLAVTLPRLAGRPTAALTATALLTALSIPLAYLGALAVGLEPLALAWSASAWLDLGLVCLILIGPFLLAAAHIGLVLAWTEKAGRAYGANLAGSAAGCLAAALALAYLTPNQALYPALGLTLLGSAAYLPAAGGRGAAFWGAAAVIIISLAWVFPLPLQFAPFKDRSAVLAAQASRLEDRAVGLHGLTEIIGGPAFHYAPGLSLRCSCPLPEQRGLFVDGDLVGPITKWTTQDPPPAFTQGLMQSLPYEVIGPDRVLIINPGGGLDLLTALAASVKQITGVEENPEIFSLMNGPWSDFTGRLYRRTGVKIIRDDPAVFLTRTPDYYDQIVLGYGGGLSSGSGLEVTRLLTVEELTALLGRLSPGGALVLSGPLMNPPRASIKILATAAEAMKRLNADPAEGLALVRDWNTVLLLVKPDGFSPDQAEQIRAAAARLNFDLSVLPGLEPKEINRFHVLPAEPLAEAGRLILDGRSEELFDRAYFHLRPGTRDRPYFFHFFRFRTLGLILSPQGGQPLGAAEWGLLFTWGGFFTALLLAVIGILAPLVRLRPRPPGLPFFGLIGLGYMLAEITLLAETIYRLGRPALAVPLVVGAFLLASGLGSRWWGDRPPKKFVLASALALPLALAGLRWLPGGAVGAGLALAPAALVMGAPFAGGLTHLVGSRPGARAWAFGVNGFFSVVGALGAGLLCLQAGHTPAVLAAGLCYLAAGLYLRGVKP